MRNRFFIPAILIFLAAFSRLIPHPPNWTILGAVMVFSALRFGPFSNAAFIALVSIFLSDVAICLRDFGWQSLDVFAENFFYQGIAWNYFAILLSVGLSSALKQKPWILNATASSLLFFALSNFGTWLSTDLYTKDWSGLGACLMAGIPYYKWSLASDLFFLATLMGLENLANKLPGSALRTQV
jgi:hypothetical protein